MLNVFPLRVTIAACLSLMAVGSIFEKDSPFSYQQKGRDWPGVCALGQRQSPVDIPTGSDRISPNYESLVWSQNVNFITDHKEITNVTVSGQNNHYNVFFTGGMMVTWDTNSLHQMYKPEQFHVHAPSEHTFDGEHYDLELHIVHKHVRENKFAVLAVFFDVEKGGSTTNDFISSLRPDLENPTVPRIHLQSVVDKIDSDKSYFYSGSLTTPPCSENVNWVLVDDPQPISPSQIEMIKSSEQDIHVFGLNEFGNNREVQPLNDRQIYKRYRESYDLTFVQE